MTTYQIILITILIAVVGFYTFKSIGMSLLFTIRLPKSALIKVNNRAIDKVIQKLEADGNTSFNEQLQNLRADNLLKIMRGDISSIVDLKSESFPILKKIAESNR